MKRMFRKTGLVLGLLLLIGSSVFLLGTVAALGGYLIGATHGFDSNIGYMAGLLLCTPGFLVGTAGLIALVLGVMWLLLRALILKLQ
jgi:hypothetical protein